MSTGELVVLCSREIPATMLRDCLWVESTPVGTYWSQNRASFGGLGIERLEDYFDHGDFRLSPRRPVSRKLSSRYGVAEAWPYVLRIYSVRAWDQVVAAMIMRLHQSMHILDPGFRMLVADQHTSPVFCDDNGRVIMARDTHRWEFLPWVSQGPSPDLGQEELVENRESSDLFFATRMRPDRVLAALEAWRNKSDRQNGPGDLYVIGPVLIQQDPLGLRFRDPNWTWTVSITFPPDQLRVVFMLMESLCSLCFSVGIDAVAIDSSFRTWMRANPRAGVQVSNIHDMIFPDTFHREAVLGDLEEVYLD